MNERREEETQEEEQKEVTGGTGDLRSEYFSEKVVIDSYVTAGTSALASADGVADKIVTASFSVATAYTAVVALVTPKDSVSPLLVIAPFVLLAVAILLALIAQSVQLKLEPATNDVSEVSRRVTSSTGRKRNWGYGALAALIVGLGVAGYAVYDTYGPGAKKKDTTVTAQIWLSQVGRRLVLDACGKAANPLVGKVVDEASLSSGSVALDVTKVVCPTGAGTVVLPRRAIAIAKHASG